MRSQEKQAQSIPDREIAARRHGFLFEVVNRCPEQQRYIIVGASGTIDDHLCRYGARFRGEQQRLLGREMPIGSKAVIAVTAAKLPE